jgi:hypothetical protein
MQGSPGPIATNLRSPVGFSWEAQSQPFGWLAIIHNAPRHFEVYKSRLMVAEQSTAGELQFTHMSTLYRPRIMHSYSIHNDSLEPGYLNMSVIHDLSFNNLPAARKK